MTDLLKLALPQLAPMWLSREAGLDQVIATIKTAAKEGADLIAFSESFVPGYPFWLDGTGGANFDNTRQKEIFAHYSDQAVTIEDGHLDKVCAALKSANMACYLGLIERPRNRTGHSLYCSYVYIDKTGTVQSIHRKLQPTYEERLVWSPGDGHGLVTHRLGAFTVGGLNCWENWMPLARAALYGQGEDLHVMGWPGSDRNTRRSDARFSQRRPELLRVCFGDYATLKMCAMIRPMRMIFEKASARCRPMAAPASPRLTGAGCWSLSWARRVFDIVNWTRPSCGASVRTSTRRAIIPGRISRS